MILEKNQDFSVYYWLKNMFEIYPFVRIVDGFPLTELSVPSISIDPESLDYIKWELGTNVRQVERVWYINIFANTKTQRDEFAYKIARQLEDNIPVYDYEEGFPPETSPKQTGVLRINDIRVEFIRILPELVDKLYYRAAVTFSALYEQI